MDGDICPKVEFNPPSLIRDVRVCVYYGNNNQKNDSNYRVILSCSYPTACSISSAFFCIPFGFLDFMPFLEQFVLAADSIFFSICLDSIYILGNVL